MNNNIYNVAKSKFGKYLEKNITDYSQLRNYDFGISRRDNVSNISEFISHRILYEFQIIKLVLSKYNYQRVEKYIQELFWRVYWKGWLENRPQVWDDFISNNEYKNDNYQKAISGNTDIECFNDWVNELKNYNYLHNHTRMWFASIWIFTLKLPWQLGAEFFFKHLLDGDAASNLLSWRWVAGLQTKGKHYVAKSWNIEKFTNNRYKNILLNEAPEPIQEKKTFSIEEKIIPYNYEKKNDYIILFENDLFKENRIKFYSRYKKIIILLIENKFRKIQIRENVINFKKQVLRDFKSSFANSEIIDLDDFFNLVKSKKKFDVVYPFVGENLDFVRKVKNDYKLDLEFIFRNEDTFCWNFAKKGFFNFKNNISKIIQSLNLQH